MTLLVDVLKAARRGEMGSLANAVRYCNRIANAAGADCGVYAEAAEILSREHLESMRLADLVGVQVRDGKAMPA